jgi:hypothetical protein
MATQEVNLYRGRPAPASVGKRGAGVQMDDLWAQEQLGHSAYDSEKSYRTAQLDQMAKDIAQIKLDVAAILTALKPGGSVTGGLTPGDHEAIKNDVKNALREGTS